MPQPPLDVVEISSPSDEVILLKIIGEGTFHTAERESFCMDIRRSTMEIRGCSTTLLRTIHIYLWELVDDLESFHVGKKEVELQLSSLENRCEILRRCRKAIQECGAQAPILSRTATELPVAV